MKTKLTKWTKTCKCNIPDVSLAPGECDGDPICPECGADMVISPAKAKKAAGIKTITWAEFALLCENYWAKIEGEEDTTYVPNRFTEDYKEDCEIGDGFDFNAELGGDVAGDADWTFLEEDNEMLKVKGREVIAQGADGIEARISFLRTITDIPAILKDLE